MFPKCANLALGSFSAFTKRALTPTGKSNRNMEQTQSWLLNGEDLPQCVQNPE